MPSKGSSLDWSILGCVVSGKVDGNTLSSLGMQYPSEVRFCTVSCPTQHAYCTDGTYGGSLAECTGFTGYVFTAAKCVGGAQAANPYNADSNGTLCTSQGGDYTQSMCRNDNNEEVGDSSSKTLCEGEDNGSGHNYTASTGELDFSVVSLLNSCKSKNDTLSWADLGCAVSGDPNGTNVTSLGMVTPVNSTYQSCSVSCPVDGGDFVVVSLLAPVADEA